MIIDEHLMLNLLLATLICFGAGAVVSLLVGKSNRAVRLLGHACALLGALCALAFGAAGLAGGTLSLSIPQLLPIAPRGIMFGIDRMSAFFVVVVAVGA